jgi:hypothetical protein
VTGEKRKEVQCGVSKGRKKKKMDDESDTVWGEQVHEDRQSVEKFLMGICDRLAKKSTQQKLKPITGTEWEFRMWTVELAGMAVQESFMMQQQLWDQWHTDVESWEAWNCQK